MNSPTPKPPSYVVGYWRPWNENADALASYMDYTRDVSLARYGANTVGQYIAQASREHVRAINSLSESLGIGFSQLTAGLTKTDHKLSDIGDTLAAVEGKLSTIDGALQAIGGKLDFLNRNIDLLVDQQRLSNRLLKNITALLRVPDSEKERHRSIELGIKYFINARNDPDLYADALEMLLKAEALMRQDYFVLHRIGCIYLHVDKHLDVVKALDYFMRAGKYASVESDPQALQLANAIMANDAMNSEACRSPKSIGLLAADSYEKAAFAAYVLGKDSEAVRYQAKCIELNPTARNRFTLSKYLVRSGQVEEGVATLEQSLTEAPLLLAAVFRDIDLVNEPDVLRNVEKQTVAASVLKVFDKRQEVVNLVLTDTSRQWRQQCALLTDSLSPWADVKGVRKFQNECARLAKIVERAEEIDHDGKVELAFQALNGGSVVGKSYRIPHEFLVDARLRLRNYERFYRTLYSLDFFGEEDRVHLREILERLTDAGIIQSGLQEPNEPCHERYAADPEAGLILAEALTLVAIADGRVSADEQSAIVMSVHKVGFVNSEESVRQRIAYAFGQMRANGVSVFADSLRERLASRSDGPLAEIVLTAIEQWLGHDGIVLEKEQRIVDWFQKHFAK